MPATGEHSEQRPESRAPQHWRDDPAEVRSLEPKPLDMTGDQRPGVAVLEVANDLGQSEHRDGQRDEVQPAVELANPERETGLSGVEVLAHGAEQEPEDDHGQGLGGGAAG